MTPSGIEPATFRFVAQHLNHCATVVPIVCRGMCIWKYVEQSCVLCVDLVAGRQSAGLRGNHKVILLYIICRIKGDRLYREAQNMM